MILHNIINITFFTWRSIFGPIHPMLAIFETYFANLWGSISFLLVSEMSLFNMLMVLKWSWIVEVDEIFVGNFLMLFNLGYILVSQTARFVYVYLITMPTV